MWVEEDGAKNALSESCVSLPTFADRRHGPVLRVLHQELLVNVVDGRPVPNLFVYPKPWYRDGAMMAMAFEKTGNLHVIKLHHGDGTRLPSTVRTRKPLRHE